MTEQPPGKELSESFQQLVKLGVFEPGGQPGTWRLTDWGKKASPKEIEAKARKMKVKLT